jgi:hypothetical protein
MPLRNENSPITDPITEMGVAHAFEPLLINDNLKEWPSSLQRITNQ